MGFVLKKIISTLMMPLSIGIILLLVGLFYLSKSQIRRAKQFISFATVWLFTLSYAPIANLLLYPLEQLYPTCFSVPSQTHYIYVLGYGHTTDESLPLTSQIDAEAIIRLNEGIRLYKQLNGDAKLILSGYDGLFDPTSHAVMQQKLAISLGIPKHDIITVPLAKDTQEEAEAALKITQGKPLILVTSAYHMPRAIQWFIHAGLHPTPAPTYHQASLKHLNYLGIFSVDALHKSTVAFHEYLGLAWQKIQTFYHSFKSS
jgi:uncharacterized SAM-binding protein YcdF (DUF218 family)